MRPSAELTRVREAIASTILQFKNRVGIDAEFHCEELRRFVIAQFPGIAPASPDRVLRDLRTKGVLDYVVISRPASLYKFV